MAEVIQLPAEARERGGKGAARSMRREGRIPAVIYGDKKDVTMLTMDVRHIAKEYNKGGFFSRLFEVVIDGKAERVLPRDVQLHPVTDVPMHADFLRLSKGVKIRINIPVNFINDEESIGLKRGGILNIVRHEIEFMVPPDSIPEAIIVDMEKWDVGDSIHIEDITLPDDITATIDRNFTIATIASPVVEKEVEEDGEEGGEGGEGEDAEAAEGDAEGDAEE
jgi:large subunit ribosomal protein L25